MEPTDQMHVHMIQTPSHLEVKRLTPSNETDACAERIESLIRSRIVSRTLHAFQGQIHSNSFEHCKTCKALIHSLDEHTLLAHYVKSTYAIGPKYKSSSTKAAADRSLSHYSAL